MRTFYFIGHNKSSRLNDKYNDQFKFLNVFLHGYIKKVHILFN